MTVGFVPHRSFSHHKSRTKLHLRMQKNLLAAAKDLCIDVHSNPLPIFEQGKGLFKRQ
jgi:hypothetical protein